MRRRSPYFDDYDEAILYLREQVKAWANNVPVCVSDEVYQRLESDVWDDVLAHTGVPNEGDYLRWFLGGFWNDQPEQQEDGSWLIAYGFSYWDTHEEELEVDAAVEGLVSSLGLHELSVSDHNKIKAILRRGYCLLQLIMG